MKRLICLLLAVVLCFGMSGCCILKPYTDYVTKSGSGVPKIFGRPYLEIADDGMSPLLKSGETVFLKSVEDPTELENGDVIAYWTVVNGERVIDFSRIVAIYDGGGYYLFETKDDNAISNNPLVVHESEIIGVY